MPTPAPNTVTLTYHGRTYAALPCGTYGRRSTPVYWLVMGSSCAVARGKDGGQAKGLLIHSGTSSGRRMFETNLEKIAWDRSDAARAARAWAARQCVDFARAAVDGGERAVRRGEGPDDLARWAELNRKFAGWALDLSVPIVTDDECSEGGDPEAFRDAVLEVHAALERVPPRGRGWQDHEATKAYMLRLSQASDRKDAPHGARLELDDMFGDIMASIHPTEEQADHGRRLLMLVADRSEANGGLRGRELAEATDPPPIFNADRRGHQTFPQDGAGGLDDE